MTRGERRESLNLRISPELKRQVTEYSQRLGISINAAAAVLLARAVAAETTAPHIEQEA